MPELPNSAHEATDAQAFASFEEASRYFLGVSAAEFMKRYRDGQYTPLDQYPGAIEVLMLAPASLTLR